MNSLLTELAAIAAFAGTALLKSLPFLLVSLPLAMWLRHSGLSSRIRSTLGARPGLAILLATAAGALSPLCSCGVVPAVAALLAGGVPLAPVMSFWLASPSMDPEIFFLSAGTLGWNLAFWRLGATFAMSLGAGFLTLAVERKGLIGSDYLKLVRESGGTAGAAARVSFPSRAAFAPAPYTPAACASAACAAAGSGPSGSGGSIVVAPARAALSLYPAPACSCAGSKPALPFAVTSARGPNSAVLPMPAAKAPAKISLAALAKEALAMAARLAVLLSVAFVMEALIQRWLPAELASRFLGKESPFAVPLAALVSVPLYTTGLSSLGIVAGLMRQGMSEAAGLAFLVGGSVTTIPAMAAVWGVVKPRVFALYLGFSLGGALLAGLAMVAFG